jgi:hypothetical protein
MTIKLHHKTSCDSSLAFSSMAVPGIVPTWKAQRRGGDVYVVDVIQELKDLPRAASTSELMPRTI